MINTVIINGQKQERDKIVALLSAQSDIKVLASGKDSYDALKLIDSLRPDIAIIDNHLGFIPGEEIAPLLKARSPSTAVVIMTGKMSDSQLYRGIANEVSGFVCKETDMDYLPIILKCISKGVCFASSPFAARIQPLFSAIIQNVGDSENLSTMAFRVKISGKQSTETKFSSREDPVRFLTKTERKIVIGIGEGYTSEEIAEELILAKGTVKNYVSSVMRKLSLKDRSQIAVYAFRCGLVPQNSCFLKLPRPDPGRGTRKNL